MTEKLFETTEVTPEKERLFLFFVLLYQNHQVLQYVKVPIKQAQNCIIL